MRKAKTLIMSAATFLETYIVLSNRNLKLWEKTQNFIEIANIKVVPFGENECEFATKAYGAFGKGRGHKAQLNYGDCMAYATAKSHGMPLLYMGNDFKHTDINSVL